MPTTTKRLTILNSSALGTPNAAGTAGVLSRLSPRLQRTVGIH